jgi:hypothetical protein
MGRNDARAQVGEPKVTPVERAKEDAIVTPRPAQATIGEQLVNHDATEEERAAFISSRDSADQRRETVARDSAALVLGHGGLMARAYALAAADHCKGADTNGASRASARRLLRLALAHLEA